MSLGSTSASTPSRFNFRVEIPPFDSAKKAKFAGVERNKPQCSKDKRIDEATAILWEEDQNVKVGIQNRVGIPPGHLVSTRSQNLGVVTNNTGNVFNNAEINEAEIALSKSRRKQRERREVEREAKRKAAKIEEENDIFYDAEENL